ncbi:gamma-glutamylcyclotransferase family protein [Magnetospirillum fulvum]|uniref:AIG2-like family protein n=1 Tax=Magnetospirillum fulvum TaxID=1082 RepID=A0A1H6H6U9_MAGFU|nr:gamma-glutamylcyclotransferase family protein [Magnetospirillum fulvum]SEH31156.1 AIG2-like family protein [Magnetospirillum fulvum]
MSIRPTRRRLLYFAYGGDMHPDQIGERCEAAELVCRARLQSYRLAFHGRSRVWDGGQETVTPDPKGVIHGVLYRLSASDFDRLDIWQGVRIDGGGSYFHSPVDVIDEQGRLIDALIYRKAVDGAPAPPSHDFLRHLVAGATARDLSPAYIAALAAIPSRPADFPVPREDRTAAALLSGMSCAC